jgi:hypothetical protein
MIVFYSGNTGTKSPDPFLHFPESHSLPVMLSYYQLRSGKGKRSDTTRRFKRLCKSSTQATSGTVTCRRERVRPSQ